MKLQIFCLVLVLFAAGCGGGGGGDDPGSGIDPRVARLDAFDAQRIRVLGDVETGAIGMAPTPDAAIPVTGAADFDGFATIRVENPSAPLVLYGDTLVTVGFDTGDATGAMSAFFGTNATGEVVDYAGEIAIDAGRIATDVSLDYGGVLTEGTNTLVFDGTMTGAFLGDPLAALTTSDLEAGVIYNGALVDATLVVVAETPPPP
ncbi:hypothetical protein [Yoonia sp. I 8.24]|uniref:hypothetical protein n=1 Tax=Yoonia sp. I 8.24 TaxID=1537229 RepID=UPI001EDE881C|nr:hypothetical protein [Yoonia sp. I 8.24]MCG3266478.1 hypothetical protein [Yoonia sp. I 8.24]